MCRSAQPSLMQDHDHLAGGPDGYSKLTPSSCGSTSFASSTNCSNAPFPLPSKKSRKAARLGASSSSVTCFVGKRAGRRALSTLTSKTRKEARRSATVATSFPPSSSDRRGRVDRPLLRRRMPKRCSWDASLSRLMLSTLTLPGDRDAPSAPLRPLELEGLVSPERRSGVGRRTPFHAKGVLVGCAHAAVRGPCGLQLDLEGGRSLRPSPEHEFLEASADFQCRLQVSANDVGEEAKDFQHIGLARAVGTDQNIQRAQRHGNFAQAAKILHFQLDQGGRS